MKKLTAPYALKKYIVEYAKTCFTSGPLDTEAQINNAFSEMHSQIGCDAQQDIMEGHFPVDMEIPYDFLTRYCEVELVAIQDNYGNYIGFPRYYGGGKHFDVYSYFDTSIDNAHYLSCEEKEVLTIQRTWAKI